MPKEAMKLGLALVIAGLGFYGGTEFEKARNERDLHSMIAVNAAGTAGLCANSLQAISEGRVEVARKVLEDRMAAETKTAFDEAKKMPKTAIAMPNIVEGMRRTADYAHSHQMPQVAGEATGVADSLAAASN